MSGLNQHIANVLRLKNAAGSNPACSATICKQLEFDFKHPVWGKYV